MDENNTPFPKLKIQHGFEYKILRAYVTYNEIVCNFSSYSGSSIKTALMISSKKNSQYT